MSKTNKRSNKRSTRTRKSLKGKWGHIGAPPKPMKFPGRPFVMAALFALNPTLCELTVRKNVDKALETGLIVELQPLPQKGGAVGRPKSRFVLKSKFVASKMTLRPAKTVTVTTATVTPAPVTPEPTPAPVVETVTEATPVATPAPEAPLPATEVATVAEIPAAPAVEAPVAPLSETPATPAVDSIQNVGNIC